MNKLLGICKHLPCESVWLEIIHKITNQKFVFMKKLSLLFGLMAVFALSFTLVSCGDDDSTTDPTPQNIAEIAAGDEQFSTLVSALDRVGLVSVLEGTGPFTVFAPTNTAFANSGINLDDLTDDQLTEVLLYHVLGGSLASAAIQEGQTYATTAAETAPNGGQLSVLVEKAGTTVTVNGTASVSTADVEATNGIIHIVNEVLLPPSVVDIAVDNSDFSELVTALGAASGDLVNVLSGDGPFTVFAPTNKAFTDIADVTATLDADQLSKVLTYHVVAGNITSGQLSDGMMVETVNGESFTVGINGSSVTLTDAGGNVSNVVFTDVQGTNGVVHVLDKVIIPNDL